MFFQQLINGLAVGSIYALVAVGYSMVYGVLKLINFANNAFMVGGAFLLILFYSRMNMPYWLAIILALLLCGFGAVFMERASLNPIRKKGAQGISALICTVGYSTVITNGLLAAFGSQTIAVPSVFKFDTFTLWGAVIDPFTIIILATAMVMMIILTYLTYATKTGEAMRAISQNMTATQLMGVNVNRIITITFFIGTFCAALSGVMIGIYYSAVDTTMSFTIGIKTFAAAILGGIGMLHGSLVGGLVIGLLETFVAGYISAGYKDAIAFIILILVLIIRPSGLFGKNVQNKV
ncbi:MAG: branched-chain amino acid ABC transporter permease [Oscillospiraceae bacterium]|nr:branched-chain amino acid ABC transporter permease [Oscillospiraceae bacterium]